MTLAQPAPNIFRHSRRETSPFAPSPSNKNSPNYLEGINYRVTPAPPLARAHSAIAVAWAVFGD